MKCFFAIPFVALAVVIALLLVVLSQAQTAFAATEKRGAYEYAIQAEGAKGSKLTLVLKSKTPALGTFKALRREFAGHRVRSQALPEGSRRIAVFTFGGKKLTLYSTETKTAGVLARSMLHIPGIRAYRHATVND